MSQETYLNSAYAEMVYETFKHHIHENTLLFDAPEASCIPEVYATKLFEQDILPASILQKIILPKLQTIVDAAEKYEANADKITESFVQIVVNAGSRLDRDYSRVKRELSPWSREENFRSVGGYLNFKDKANTMAQPLTFKIAALYRKQGNPTQQALTEINTAKLTSVLIDLTRDIMCLNYVTGDTKKQWKPANNSERPSRFTKRHRKSTPTDPSQLTANPRYANMA